ncbi:sugar-binding transcriptional regulator [Actinotignum sp. GS-2025a]|uniref:sugar-binding transcriptional regulator n=1 Tax=Actinotignum sp. GS-2025a TaxID=3427274 RepID=UPI003F445581
MSTRFTPNNGDNHHSESGAISYAEHMSKEAHTIYDREHLELLLEVSKRYYLDNAKQSDIAAEIGYSRVTVSRLLAQARAAGIVKIEISHPSARLLGLEQQLLDTYQLKEVRVVATSEADTKSAIGSAAADVLLAHCNPRSTVAISNGRAVSATVAKLPRRTWTSSCVVPILGMTGSGLPFIDSPDLCRAASKKLGGNHWVLPVPLVFETELAAQAMSQEPSVHRTLDLAARADVALVGVGAVSIAGSSPLLRKWITHPIQRELARKHAVAHLNGHYLNAQGKHVDVSLCRRTVCLHPSKLRDIPFVVGVAYGTEKVAAIEAVLVGGYLDALITDDYTAAALVEEV